MAKWGIMILVILKVNYSLFIIHKQISWKYKKKKEIFKIGFGSINPIEMLETLIRKTLFVSNIKRLTANCHFYFYLFFFILHV